ncbi:MAG: helix-hairpin-helix domain-containing protein, partial [Firmicutes bacterium]|nr:helix-hairpin-helix domain-containing protein [Bacillota bacterium]
DLQKLEGFKDKKTDNLITAIAKSLNCNIENFIYALGIENVGTKLAKELCAHFKTLEGIMTAKYDELVKIYDVGDAVARSIVEYFERYDNLENVNKLIELGLKFKEVKKSESGKFLNQTVVLTGTLENFKRAELEKLIVNSGGSISSSVTKQTTLLICGEGAGSKLEKAKELNVKIIDEKELLKILND